MQFEVSEGSWKFWWLGESDAAANQTQEVTNRYPSLEQVCSRLQNHTQFFHCSRLIMSDSIDPKAPWYAAYPLARTQTPAAIDRAQLLQLIKNSENVTKSYLLVDLRCADHEVSAEFIHLHQLFS